MRVLDAHPELVGCPQRPHRVAQRRPVITGMERLAGQTGFAVSEIDPSGQAQVAGELWSADLADASTEVHRGERVEVVRVEGLRLKVRKM